MLEMCTSFSLAMSVPASSTDLSESNFVVISIKAVDLKNPLTFQS